MQRLMAFMMVYVMPTEDSMMSQPFGFLWSKASKVIGLGSAKSGADN
jgi:hypothetical protein